MPADAGNTFQKGITMANPSKIKNGPKFNIFDILIILAVLVCVGAIIFRVFFISETQEDFRHAYVTFKVEGVSEETAQAFCIANREIYLQNGDAKIGTIAEASYTALPVLAEDAGGKLIAVDHPLKKQIVGSAVMTGYWGSDGFLLGGTHLVTVGSTFNIYTKDVACTITIVHISENQ